MWEHIQKAEAKEFIHLSLILRKALSEPKLAAKLGNPTYVATNKNNTILYSIEKADGQGGVAAYQIDKTAAN